MEASDKILSGMGKYPVIKLSLKLVKQPSFKTEFKALRDEIKSEYTPHSYIVDSDKLSAEERRIFKNLSMRIDD